VSRNRLITETSDPDTYESYDNNVISGRKGDDRVKGCKRDDRIYGNADDDEIAESVQNGNLKGSKEMMPCRDSGKDRQTDGSSVNFLT
jgi:hypothetical protein